MSGRTVVVMLLLAAASQAAQACRMAPRVQLASPEALLARATDVALVRVAGAVARDADVTEYTLQVVERLAGPPRAVFTLDGAPAGHEDKDGRGGAADHEGPAFWVRGGGRVMNDPACRIRPSFRVGATYLVILDQPWTRRSFEHIPAGAAGDKWLHFVRYRLGQQMLGDGVAQ